MTELLDDLEGGWVKSVAFVVPGGCGWPLPLYELALLTSSYLAGERVDGVELMLVTPEAAALELFGPDAAGTSAGYWPVEASACSPARVRSPTTITSWRSRRRAGCASSASSRSRGSRDPA